MDELEGGPATTGSRKLLGAGRGHRRPVGLAGNRVGRCGRRPALPDRERDRIELRRLAPAPWARTGSRAEKGGNGDDGLFGFEGDDLLDGGAGKDVVDGGAPRTCASARRSSTARSSARDVCGGGTGRPLPPSGRTVVFRWKPVQREAPTSPSRASIPGPSPLKLSATGSIRSYGTRAGAWARLAPTTSPDPGALGDGQRPALGRRTAGQYVVQRPGFNVTEKRPERPRARFSTSPTIRSPSSTSNSEIASARPLTTSKVAGPLRASARPDRSRRRSAARRRERPRPCRRSSCPRRRPGECRPPRRHRASAAAS